MSVGEDPFDALAHALVSVEFDFDAVERDTLRAEWDSDGATVVVRDTETDAQRRYVADDLVIATSDREVKHARQNE